MSVVDHIVPKVSYHFCIFPQLSPCFRTHAHTTDSTQHITSRHITLHHMSGAHLLVVAPVSGQAIVVGGGLAGMSAANTILENGGRFVFRDLQVNYA